MPKFQPLVYLKIENNVLKIDNFKDLKLRFRIQKKVLYQSQVYTGSPDSAVLISAVHSLQTALKALFPRFGALFQKIANFQTT